MAVLQGLPRSVPLGQIDGMSVYIAEPVAGIAPAR